MLLERSSIITKHELDFKHEISVLHTMALIKASASGLFALILNESLGVWNYNMGRPVRSCPLIIIPLDFRM
jgi:hypothetical protein